MLGYMEQTVATAISKACTAVGNFKPKYPFLNPTKSALVYVAYHLKGSIIQVFSFPKLKSLRSQTLKRKQKQACRICGILLFFPTAFNPKSSEYVRKKYKKKLEQFEETCELIRYLGDNMSRRYREPQERPIDFDFKMNRFMTLKGVPAASTWVS